MRLPRLACWLLVSGLGCREVVATQLVVVVQTDLVAPTEVDALAVRVNGAAPPGDPFAALSQSAFPASFGVKPRGGDASRQATIEVSALSAGTPVVSQRVIASFVREEQMRVDLYLSGSCRSVRCDDPGQTCWFGECIDAAIVRDGMRPYRPGDPALDAAVALDAEPGVDAGVDAAVDAGLGRLGELCSRDDLCGEGLLCSSWDLIAEIPDPGTCLLQCLAAEDCQARDPDASCIPTEGPIGFCTQPCDPRGPAGDCPEGTRCSILSFPGADSTATLCVAPGTGALGEACSAMTCAAPYHCVLAGGLELCREACDMDAPGCPPEAPRCTLTDPVEVDGRRYAVCLP